MVAQGRIAWRLVRSGILALAGFILVPSVPAETKILFVGHAKDSHPPRTHEYMAGCDLLSQCLKQTPDVAVKIISQWPEDLSEIDDADVLALYGPQGGNVLFDGPQSAAIQKRLDEGVGLACLHWSTGAAGDEIGTQHLKATGGWFHRQFATLGVHTLRLHVNRKSPIAAGVSDFDLHDEFYFKLRYMPRVEPVVTTRLGGETHTLAWAYERPDSSGRSFGFVCGHFYKDFSLEPFRKLVVNGILWTGRQEIPKGGAPCDLNAGAFEKARQEALKTEKNSLP